MSIRLYNEKRKKFKPGAAHTHTHIYRHLTSRISFLMILCFLLLEVVFPPPASIPTPPAVLPSVLESTFVPTTPPSPRQAPPPKT